jgi:hypothetical protein
MITNPKIGKNLPMTKILVIDDEPTIVKPV